MTGPQPTGRASDPAAKGTLAQAVPMSLFIAALIVTIIVASTSAVFVFRWLSAPETPGGTLKLAATPVPTASPATPSTDTPVGRQNTSRLIVNPPDHRFGGGTGTYVKPGSDVDISLPQMSAQTSAVLLQVSMRNAAAPGLNTLESSAETVPVFRLAATGAQTSATVVAVLGADQRLNLSTEGGGRLSIDLLGRFERTPSSAAGRIVPVPPVRALDLVPGQGGHDATLDLSRLSGLPPVGGPTQPVSAVILRVAGEVGRAGGYMKVGPSPDDLDQLIFWGGTQPDDPIRNGFLVVPLQSPTLHIRYHAGHELRLELAGYVTGGGAADGTTGLAVPVPATSSPAVRVSARGASSVTVVGPDGGPSVQGAPGLTAGQVSAVITTLVATGDRPGPVSVTRPGAPAPAIPDLSAAATTRSALALSQVSDGRVTVTSGGGAAVILIPRLFILA